MNRQNVTVFGIFDFLYIFASCLLARLLSNIVVKVADLFVKLDFLPASAIRMVTLFIFSIALIALFSFADGYRYATFDVKQSAASASAAALLHCAIAPVFSFNPIMFGATRHISGFIAFGSMYNSNDRIERIPMTTLLIVAFVTACIYAAACVLGNCFGCKKRLADRKAITGSENPQHTN